MSMNPQQCEDNLDNLLGKFPNTYTFTKNLAEKSLMKNRGDLRVVLLRPAIIASAVEEPLPGWTDSLSAAGGISLLTGLGLINFINAKGDNKFDMIPVDIVTNSILVATAYAISQPPKMEVYNSGTSVSNPITMLGYKDEMIRSFQFHKFNRQAFPVHVQFVKSKTEYNIKKAIYQEIPTKILQGISNLPYVGTPKLKAQVALLQAIQDKT